MVMNDDDPIDPKDYERQMRSEIKLTCPECGEELPTARGLGTHRSLKHGIPGKNAAAHARAAADDEEKAAPMQKGTREEKKKTPRPTSPPLPKVTKAELHENRVIAAGAILTFDRILRFIIPGWSEVAITTEEIGQEYVVEAVMRGAGGMTLAEVTGDEISNSEWLRRMLSKSKGKLLHGKTAMVYLSVLLPRLARLGMLPPDLQGVVDAATSVEGRGAHGGDRDDRERQEHPASEPAGSHAQAFRGAQEQGGQGGVSGSPAGTNGTGYGESAIVNPPGPETAV